MAVNFGLLQPAQPASAFFQGQQDVQREAEQNMLRQAQMENMAAQRAERLAMTQDREALTRDRAAKAAQAAKRQEFLAGLSTKMAEGGYKLDRPTLGQVLQFGMQTGEDSLIKLATEGMRALDEEDRYRQEATRLGLPGAAPAPAAAPSIMRQPAAAAPAAPTNMLAGTPFDIGVGAPAPANALAAPPAAAPAGITREMAQQMILSPNPRIREQGKALVGTLPKEPAAPAPTELSKLQREINALPPGDPLRAQLEARQRVLTTPPQGAKVVLPPQEKAEQGKRGELLVEQYKAVSNAARTAQRMLPSLETQANILDQGFKTGFGTDVQKVGASFLGALGVPEAAKFATNAQTFLAASQDAVLAKQLEQKGSQSNADADRITQTGTQLGNTPEANRFIIDVAKAQLKRDIAQRNFYDDWWKKNKTYDGAEDAWSTGEGNKSLFDSPELRKYAAPAKPAAAPAPVSPPKSSVRDQADAILRKSRGQ
jgi:hypothetical protein